MTRREIKDKFRAENPEISARVITDGVLDDWMKAANVEICAFTRCIVANEPQVIASEEDVQFYDLSEIDRFYDIDDLSGGGVYYDGVPLKRTTASEMNFISRGWRSWPSGIPLRYWRRGKYLWLDRKPDDDDIDIEVDCVLIPNDFDNDDEQPFDDLGHLQPYHDGISKYLQWRAKAKVGKSDEAAIAVKDYKEYCLWMRKLVRGYSHHTVQMKPADR